MVSVAGIGFRNINNLSSVSFGGHNLSSDDEGKKVYKFFIPKVYFNDAKVILKKFELDENGNIDVNSDYPEDERAIPRGQHFVEVNPEDIDLDEHEVLGYKFVIDNMEYTDKHRNVTALDGSVYNIADMLSTDVLQTPKSIYHIIPSTFNPTLKQKREVNGEEIEVFSDDKTARINHFMKYDTSLQDIIAKVPYMKQLGFRRVLATPIFGQDNISSHGYWTNNPFQITERLGSMKDFADLQIALFKNSMGYIADGAFTNEGLSGIHIRDIYRHGANSPFIKWFELFNYPSSNIKLGVLPDTQRAYDNFDIRVVNSPVFWTVDRTGKPIGDFGRVNKAYNPNKETYIQIYDRRLTSQEQLKKDEVFNTYAIRNTQNPDEVSDWMDSVQPYAFPVNPAIVIKKANLARKDGSKLPKSYLMKWENFELAKAKDSAGILLWNGNKDIAKLRFVFPNTKKQRMIENAQNRVDAQREVAQTQEATQNVQNYIASVGEFWTNKTAKILREYIALELAGAKTPQEFKQKIDTKAGVSLPDAMKYITTAQIDNAINNNYEASNMLQVPNNLFDALSEYPLEAIEVSDDLTSVMAYPQFKAGFDSEVMPVMEEFAAQILRKLDVEKLQDVHFYKKGRLSNDGTKLLQLVSDDIKRFLVLKSLNPELKAEDILSYSATSLSKLKDISVKRLNIESKNPDATAAKLLSLMKANTKLISPKDIREMIDILGERLSKITPESLKVADLIIDKAEAGLNWRIDAAKDIADIEGFSEGEANMAETWGEVFNFWKKFNAGVKLYNNHSYKIGEFTDTGVSYSETTKSMRNAGDIEQKLIEQGGFTTQSNYNYLFDFLQKYYSAMTEYASGINNTPAATLIADKFFNGWNGVPGYLYSGNKKNIVFSHVAAGNHDKQRVAQGFAINTLLAYKNYWSKYGGREWSEQEVNEIRDDLLKSNMHKSGYYPLIERGDFGEIFKYISQPNFAKMAAYNDAFARAIYSSNLPCERADEILAAYSKALDTIASRDSSSQKIFFYKNFEATYEDIMKKMAEQGNNYAAEMMDLCAQTHKFLTEPARQRFVELAKLMVALPGNPTLYAGDELLEMGGEEKAKNASVQNRNRLHWENLEEDGYAHVKHFNDELSQIYNLRNDENLTSLVNGDTVMLKKQGDKGFRDVIGMYRYNDHDDAIILMHNVGFNSYRHFVANDVVQIPKIDLTGGDDMRTGLPHQKHLIANTMYVNALDPSQQFIVKEDGCIYNVQQDKPIELKSSVVILKKM